MGKEVLRDRLDTAARIREVRERAGLTQEKFAERLGISLSGYKKIENAENQISVSGLRKLKQNFQVTTDYILFGPDDGIDLVWEQVQSCTDTDKMYLLIKLLYYFMKVRNGEFGLRDEQGDIDKAIFHVMDEIRNI
jgi:transcriptional regulator with XRE-family HTH domain